MAKDEKKGEKVAIAVSAVKSIEELAGVGPATADRRIAGRRPGDAGHYGMLW